MEFQGGSNLNLETNTKEVLETYAALKAGDMASYFDRMMKECLQITGADEERRWQ